jgi:hypothetical protein
VDAGANIEADGAVFGGGTPMADAVAFGQWMAARRLLERGAQTNLWQAAALGLLDRVREHLAVVGRRVVLSGSPRRLRVARPATCRRRPGRETASERQDVSCVASVDVRAD